MKKLFLALVLLISLSAIGQGRYESAMKTALKMSDSTITAPDLLALSNRFERIALAEKDKWLPYYYASMSQIRYVFMLQDKSQADVLINKAESLALMADSISPSNSEISCLKSMIASCRLMVDPMSRYMTYGPASSQEIDKAIAQDPSNPRPHLLRGQGLKYTPEQFGGGCTNALPHLEAALLKFETFKPLSELHPSWGLNITEEMVSDCKK